MDKLEQRLKTLQEAQQYAVSQFNQLEAQMNELRADIVERSGAIKLVQQMMEEEQGGA